MQVKPSGAHLVLNLPPARLFHYQNGRLAQSYSVTVGKILTQPPTGNFEITDMYTAPAWHVPYSIQQEIRRSGQEVHAVVPLGRSDPIGPVFIRFGSAKLGLSFHGTNAPWLVPGFRSHGCVRLKKRGRFILV